MDEKKHTILFQVPPTHTHHTQRHQKPRPGTHHTSTDYSALNLTTGRQTRKKLSELRYRQVGPSSHHHRHGVRAVVVHMLTTTPTSGVGCGAEGADWAPSSAHGEVGEGCRAD